MNRANRLAQELLDRDWLELGVSQEEMNQSRLSTQQMNAALDEGYSMDEVLRMFDCRPNEATSTKEEPVQQLLEPDAGTQKPVEQPRQDRSGGVCVAQETHVGSV